MVSAPMRLRPDAVEHYGRLLLALGEVADAGERTPCQTYRVRTPARTPPRTAIPPPRARAARCSTCARPTPTPRRSGGTSGRTEPSTPDAAAAPDRVTVARCDTRKPAGRGGHNL